MSPEYEWDEAKRESNLVKHGVDFGVVESFEWESAIVVPSNRGGERRFAATGYIEGFLFRLIFTVRGTRVRVISLRRANGKEERQHEQGEL